MALHEPARRALGDGRPLTRDTDAATSSRAWIGHDREAHHAIAASAERLCQRDPVDVGRRRPRALARRRDRHARLAAAGGDALTGRRQFVAAGRALGHARLLPVDNDVAVACRRALVGRDTERHVADALTGGRRQRRDPVRRGRGFPRTLRLSRDRDRARSTDSLDHGGRAERHLTLHRIGTSAEG